MTVVDELAAFAVDASWTVEVLGFATQRLARAPQQQVPRINRVRNGARTVWRYPSGCLRVRVAGEVCDVGQVTKLVGYERHERAPQLVGRPVPSSPARSHNGARSPAHGDVDTRRV